MAGDRPGRAAALVAVAAACASALVAACASARVPEGWVYVSVYDADLAPGVVVEAVAKRHFDADDRGRPVGLSGPRVRIELPPVLALRVDERTLEASHDVPNPLHLPRPKPDGAFVYRAGSAAASMASAFAWATRTIDAFERWSGQRVDWGDGGRLSVFPCAFAIDRELGYYDVTARRVCLGASTGLVLEAARSPDTVVHECAHAALAVLKPGHDSGVALALNEGMADAATFLVPLGDETVLARVLERTGGNLRSGNELSRVREKRDQVPGSVASCRRALDALVTPRDCCLHREDVDLPLAMLQASGNPNDPHLVGQVVSGTLYELLVLLYERGSSSGLEPVNALARARDAVGAMMLRALAFVGEHRVSLGDWACALGCAEELLFQGAWRAEVCAALESRDLIEGPAELEEQLRLRSIRVPVFSLDPALRDPSAVLDALEELESAQVERARAVARFHRAPDVAVSFLRHRGLARIVEEVPREALSVHDDSFAADGFRVVRLVYRAPVAAKVETLDESSSAPSLRLEEATETRGYLSLAFDSSGRLADLHVDRPLE